MTKKTFIKNLRKKLSILEENEINDIVNEYETIIDDKISSGKTLEEAIEEFGNIDELTNEILKAYKINPKYNEEDVVGDFNTFIKKSANKLSNFTKNIIDDVKENNNITIETIFEIILKSIALLFILVLLRIPFEIISSLGESILDVILFPIDRVLIFIWNFFVWILYLLVAILIGISLFKENVKTIKKPTEAKNKNIKKNEKNEQKELSNFGRIFKIVAKVFTTIVFLIPIWITIISLIIIFAILIYYTVTGINFIGIACIILGIIIFLCFIASIFSKIFTGEKINFLLNIILSSVFITIGIFISIDTFRTYKYVDNVDENSFEKISITSYEKVDNILYINNCKKILDDNIKDNEIKIEYSYYDIFDLNMYRKNNKLYFESRLKEKEISLKIYNNIIDNLKNKEIYNYSKLDNIEKNIYVNKNTFDKIVCNIEF